MYNAIESGDFEDVLDTESVLRYAAVISVICGKESYLGPKAESYAPLYHLRDEVQRIKKAYFKSYSKALKKYDPEERKIVKRIFKNLLKDESN